MRRLRRPRPASNLAGADSEADHYASDKSFAASGGVARDTAAATAFLDAHTQRTPGLGTGTQDATPRRFRPLRTKGKRKDTR
jgi:hypothetical protein